MWSATTVWGFARVCRPQYCSERHNTTPASKQGGSNKQTPPSTETRPRGSRDSLINKSLVSSRPIENPISLRACSSDSNPARRANRNQPFQQPTSHQNPISSPRWPGSRCAACWTSSSPCSLPSAPPGSCGSSHGSETRSLFGRRGGSGITIRFDAFANDKTHHTIDMLTQQKEPPQTSTFPPSHLLSRSHLTPPHLPLPAASEFSASRRPIFPKHTQLQNNTLSIHTPVSIIS